MRIFVSLPEGRDHDNWPEIIDNAVPDDWNVEYGYDHGDFFRMVRLEDCDAVITVIDTTTPNATNVLGLLGHNDLRVPIICLYPEHDPAVIFKTASMGALCGIDLETLQAEKDSLKVIIENACRAFQGITTSNEWGPLKIDYQSKQVTFHGTPIRLTPTKYRAFEYLSMRENHFISDEVIENSILDPLGIKSLCSKTAYMHIYMLKQDLDTVHKGLGGIIERDLEGFRFNPEKLWAFGSRYVLRFGRLEIDMATDKVYLDSQDIGLDHNEFILFKTVALNYPETADIEALKRKASISGYNITEDRTIHIMARDILNKISDMDEDIGPILRRSDNRHYALDLFEVDPKTMFAQEPCQTLGSIRLRTLFNDAMLHRKPLGLTPLEYDVLAFLKECHPGTQPTAREVSIAIYEAENIATARHHLNNLRLKMRAANENKNVIHATNVLRQDTERQDKRSSLRYFLDIYGARRPTKNTDNGHIKKVGPWTLDSYNGKITYQESPHAKIIDIVLAPQEHMLLTMIIEAYPKSACPLTAETKIFGTAKNSKRSVETGWAALRGSLRRKTGQDPSTFMRKHKSEYIRLDVPPYEIDDEILEQCDIRELGPWAVNFTARYVTFDGDLIHTTYREFSTFSSLVRSFPISKQIQELDNVKPTLFQDEIARFEKKLEEGFGVTEPLLEDRSERTGVVLKVDRDELSLKEQQALNIYNIKDIEYDEDQGTLRYSGHTLFLIKDENFFLPILLDSDRDMDVPELQEIAKSKNVHYPEDRIVKALGQARDKLAAFGLQLKKRKMGGITLTK